MIVQLEEPEAVVAHAKSDQRDRFVSLAVAAVSRAGLAIGFRRGGQQFRRAVGPEAPPYGEKRLRRVEPPANHVAAHAVEHGIADAVAEGVARLVPAQSWFSTRKNSFENPRVS